MATLLAPLSFCEKPNTCIFKVREQRVLLRNTPDSHIVLTIPIRLVGVDDPCLR